MWNKIVQHRRQTDQIVFVIGAGVAAISIYFIFFHWSWVT